jgi:peptidyl-prolyl cis-trans isomerase A (cyclophilin A)
LKNNHWFQSQVRFGTSVDGGSSVDIEFVRSWAPIGVDHIHELLTKANGNSGSFYDGATFFRVVPGFVVQFGLAADPKLTAHWSSNRLTDDKVTQTNAPGTVTFATSGPNTRTTQLFINLGSNSYLDGMGFAPIGRVVSGMEHVKKINAQYGESPNQVCIVGKSRVSVLFSNSYLCVQGKITREGSAYTKAAFPHLDYITTTTML